MKILFLDDMASRRRCVQQWFKGDHQIHHARNASEAIGMYWLHQFSAKCAPFDLVSLDHDLGEHWDGRDVVDYIITAHRAEPTAPRPKFAIHSWNASAAAQMENKLRFSGFGFEVSREPFAPQSYLDKLDEKDNE